MQIAITGAQGQLGTELCRRLGNRAIPLDLPEFDLINPFAVTKRLLQLRPSVVINTAAFTQVDRAESEVELARKINAKAVGTLAQVCRELNCPLVQISTDYVFGGDSNRTIPYGETDSPAPLGIYALTKLEGEQEALKWQKSLVARTCGLYGRPGARTMASSFIATMLRLGREGKRLRVVNDQICTPSYVPHVAAALIELVERQATGIVHVVNSGAATWYEFALEIFRQAALSVEVEPITSAEYGSPTQRPAYSVLSTAKFQTLTGHSLPTWQRGIQEYLAIES